MASAEAIKESIKRAKMKAAARGVDIDKQESEEITRKSQTSISGSAKSGKYSRA